jgi:hypothetical protein
VTDARWLDIQEAAATAKSHLGQAVDLYRAGGFSGNTLDAYRARMAFMHAVQSGHTSLEGVLLRILDVLGEARPTGEHWHQDLIKRACRSIEGANARPPILSRELCEAIDETRRFRNLAIRGYDSFDVAKAQQTVAAVQIVVARFVDELVLFRNAIDGS